MPKKLSIQDQACAAVDLGLQVTILKPLGKIPVLKSWQSAPLTNINEVLAAFQERPQSNYGILTGWDGLFVVDIDGPEAIEWWKEQGFEQGPTTKTPRGGLHVFYRAPGGIEVQTNASKIHPKIDVRGVGGQVVGPGCMVPTGTYAGDLEAIAKAPEATPELMAIIPEKNSYTQTAPVRVEKVSAATEKERASVAWITGRLQALPEVWHEGAGWHSTVFESAAWLSRMVNSNDYSMDEDSALTILLTNTPVYPEWGEDKIIEQWESARKITDGQFAEAPSDEDDIPGLLPLLKAQVGVPEYDSRGRQFMDLVLSDAYSDTEGARWDRRRQILLESFRAGLGVQQALSLVAGSVAAGVVMREHNGRLLLFKEAKKAHREYLQEERTGLDVVETGITAAPVEVQQRETVQIVTDAERVDLVTDEYRWWGTQYLEWIENSLRLTNMPYHRLHVWMILSVVFGTTAYIPREGKRLGLNLWGVILGESSTGKTEALEKAESVIDAFFKEDSPNLGADATTEALHDALIGRDGKPSYQVIDEAHGILGELSGSKGFRGDLITRWTEFYEGRVRASLRATKKEISGKSATTSFSMLMQGTSRKMAGVMTEALWASGFLVRPLFVIGDNIEPREEDLDVRLIEGDADMAYNGMPRYWAGEWAKDRYKLRHYGEPIKMKFSPEALTRLNVGMRRMRAILKALPNQAALKPYAARFPNQILKMASLVALSEVRPEVELRHVIIALAASEEFLSAAVEMARLTIDTDYAQKVDEVERFVAERGGKVDPSKLYRSFKYPAFEVDRWVDQLVREKRIRKRPDMANGGFELEIIKATKTERKKIA